MKITLGLGLSPSRSTQSTPTGPTVTVAGSIDVSTFKIGAMQTITAGTATATGGGAITYEYRHLANGASVSTLAAYAHVAGNDTQSGVAQWRAVETGGTNAGSTSWQTVASGTITYPAPTAAAGLLDQSFTDNTGVQTYDASSDFTGSALAFSLVSAPTGVTINIGTGVVSFDTDAMSTQAGTTITVRATNSGGPVNSAFSLDITASQQIVLTSVSFNGTDTLSMTLNMAGTVSWMITDNATETAAAIIAGTGKIDGASFAVTTGANNATISYPNVTTGNHYLHIVADAATSPSPSSVDSTQYAFTATGDTTAPILSSATDAANGQTASTGSVSTDEGNGVLYWVQTTSATKPSGPQVKLGQDNTGAAADGDSGSQAVSAIGTQNITGSGLTASTSYTTHYMQEDSSNNQSTVASASGFTTAAAGGVAPAFGAAGTGRDSLNGITPTWPAHTTGDLGILVMTNRGNDSTWTPTDGWTQLYTGTSGGTGSSGRRLQVFYKIATSSSETVTNTGDLGNNLAGQIFTFTGAAAVSVLGSATASSGASVSITSGTTGGSDRRVAVICAEAGDNLTDQITSWTNANLTGLTDHGGHRTTQGAGGGFDVGSGTIATAGAVGNTTATLATATGNWVGLALEIS